MVEAAATVAAKPSGENGPRNSSRSPSMSPATKCPATWAATAMIMSPARSRTRRDRRPNTRRNVTGSLRVKAPSSGTTAPLTDLWGSVINPDSESPLGRSPASSVVCMIHFFPPVVAGPLSARNPGGLRAIFDVTATFKEAQPVGTMAGSLR